MSGTTDKHEHALNILHALRRQVVERMADLLIRNEDALLRKATESTNPLGRHYDLEDMTTTLTRLNAGIEALAEAGGNHRSTAGAALPRHREGFSAPERLPADTAAGPALGLARYGRLVSESRLEEAARELAQVLHLPLDRVTTATRFYSRAVQADPTIAEQLASLPDQARTASGAQCMGLLVRTFGFQAVESRMAIEALRRATPTSAVLEPLLGPA